MSVSYASLQDSILSGDLTSANQLAAQIVGDGTVSHNDFVESLCIQASLAAISGATSASLREITSKLRDAASDTFEQALAQYVEGVVALTVQKAPGIARQRFQTAREIDATFIFARLGLGATDFVEQKFDQCFNHYKNVLRHLGDATPNVIRVVLAVCSFRLKQFDHARRCIVRALAVEPDDPLALLVQFGIQVHFREVTAATRTISALIRIHPTIVVTQKYTDMLFFNALQSKQLAQKSAVILSLIAKTQGLAISANNDALLGYAFMQRGRLLHAEGKLADALDQYNDAIKHNPQLAAAVVHRVQLLHDLKGEAVAREELRVALEKHPRDPEVILMSTVTKASLNQHADAIRQATYLTNTVAREVPDAWSVGAWANRLDSSRYCELATFAQKLLQKAKLPVDIALDANSAVLMGDLDLFAKVASTFLHVDITTTAIEALPVSDESYPYIFNYAFLLEKSDPSKAHKIYRQLVKRCPHEAASLVRLVYMSKEMNRPFEAARWAKLLSLTHPNDRTGLVLLAWVLKEQGHAGEALTIVHEETKVKRDAQLALVTGALFLHDSQGSTHKSDKVTRAMNGFQFALRQDSDNVLAAHGAACCVALQGYSSSAAQILERVAEADCNSNVVKEGIRNHRFNIFVESHAFRSAIGLLGSQPIEKLSRWQCCALATCYARISQHEKALQVLNQALALHHNDASVCYYLVLVLLASVMEALEKTDTLTQERGTEFLERIKRALSLAKYAQRVKSETQRKNLTDIIAFVTSDNLDASVRKRMRDRAREQTHASEMTQRWQMTHQQMIAEEIAQQEAAQRIKEAKLAERTQREAILFDRTQDFINRSYTGVAVEMADPQQDGGAEQPTADALDGTELNAEELAAFMEAGLMGDDTGGAGAAAGIREREGDDELEQPPREQPSAEAENTNIPETLVVNENLQ